MIEWNSANWRLTLLDLYAVVLETVLEMQVSLERLLVKRVPLLDSLKEEVELGMFIERSSFYFVLIMFAIGGEPSPFRNTDEGLRHSPLLQ